jgi:hypothetical protein
MMLKPHFETQLLLDASIVAEAQGLRQQWYSPAKSPLNPVIVKTEPWEGEGPYLWGNRLLRDEETGEYRMWYAAFRHADNHYRWGYAVSQDGLHWEKPPLYLETFEGQPARNMLAGGPHPHKALRCLERDPRPDCPPSQRYRAIRFTYDGEFASFSPDGIHWTEYPGNPVWHVPSDIIHTMWDPNRQTFVAYYKIWEVRGMRVTGDGPPQPFRGYLPFYHNTTHDGVTDFRGPLVTFHPDGDATIEDNAEFTLQAEALSFDDGGGGMLSGAWTSKRVICWAHSDDFIQWHGERVVVEADERDDPTANIQYMFVFLYGGYYFGVLTMHDETGKFNQQLAFSRDGLTWQRPWRGYFIAAGPEGTWDSGMVLGPVDPIVLDRELRFYYGGFPIIHHGTDTTWDSAIGFATLRRDGFAAWEADQEPGVLTTQPLVCPGGRLLVNADAQGGSVRVEVLDERGCPLPRFEREQSQPLTEDAVATPMTWVSMPHLNVLTNRPIRLRFYLENARLFAFRFTPTD